MEIIKILLGSLIIPMIVAFGSAKMALKNEMGKNVYEKREEIYIELFDLLFKLQENPYLVYNYADMVKQLDNLWPKINLFSSSELIEVVAPLYKNIKSTAEKYWHLFDGPEYENRKNNEKEYEGKTELEFEQEELLYIESQLLDNEYFSQTIIKIVKIMRVDMGTRKKM